MPHPDHERHERLVYTKKESYSIVKSNNPMINDILIHIIYCNIKTQVFASSKYSIRGENMNIVKIIIDFIAYLYGAFYHTPKKKISLELAEKIRTQGVVHFGKSQHEESILSQGLLAKFSKALCPQEKDMIWLYLNEEKDMNKFWNIIKKKGERKHNDIIYYFQNVSDEQIEKMRMRSYDGAIVIVGDFSTSQMTTKYISEVINNPQV